MVNYKVILSRNSLIHFLEKVSNGKLDQAGDTKILVVLPDDIAIKNFHRAMQTRKIPLKNVSTKTLEGLAESILDPERKQMIRLINKFILTQLIINAINEGSSPFLNELKSIPINELSTQEALIDEFNEYLRATDSGTLYSHLTDAAKSLKDPFASASSTRFVESFELFEKTIAEKTETMGDNVFFSRGHLIKKAREVLTSTWPSILEVKEVLISNISVFDASVLKLIEQIEQHGRKISDFNVRLFLGVGTYRTLKDRLTKANIEFEEDIQDTECDLETKLVDNFNLDSVEFVAAPERRREVEFVANKIHELLIQGVHPSEILLVTRDCNLYLNLISQIFPAYGIAHHVQTRRPYAHLPPYRFLKATTELIVAAKSNAIRWDQITDPLRLGFCLPHSTSFWPVRPREFIALEESLSRSQSKIHNRPLSVSEWQTKILSDVRFPSARTIAQELLQWISNEVNNPPKDARDARYLLSELLEQYMLKASSWVRKAISLRVTNSERFKINEIHPTHFASIMRSNLFNLEDYLNDCIQVIKQSLDWELIDKGLELVFGKETYGIPRQDSSSVAMVDAANASFLQAKYLFLLGFRAEEFPRRCPKGIFLPDELRNYFSTAKEGESAYLYLRNNTSDYANECDIFETVLRTNPQKITFLMPYHDERNHILGWSPFVEKYRPDKNSTIILPNEWTPLPKNNDWQETGKIHPPWIRHRLYCFNSYRTFPNLNPKIDEAGLEKIASTIDPSFYHTQLKERIQRYISPPSTIEVHDNEIWFSKCSLQEIVGSPYRAHEMDLHTLCPLQWYFYQVLFLWNGDNGIDRDTIPTYYKKGNWRYGILPQRLSYIYPSTATNNKIEQVIASLPNRQADLAHFPSEADLENELRKLLTPYDMIQLSQTFADERALVLQEPKDNIKNRKWQWVKEKMPIQLPGTNDASFILPPHRVDTLQFNKKFIIAYVNFSGQLKSRNGPIVYSRERNGQENAEDPLRDYRIPLLLTHYLTKSNVAAAIYIELFNGKRIGYYNEGDLGKHKGSKGYKQELEMPPLSNEAKNQVLKPLEWNNRVNQFKRAIEERTKKMAIRNNKIAFRANPSHESCLKCVYNNLCQIPRLEAI